MLLLDTCTLLWLASDQKMISGDALKAIEKNSQGLFVSAISAFEIAIKTRQKKLALPMKAGQWYLKALTHHGIYELPVNGDVAVSSVALDVLHQDPCDRMIIATALRHHLSIVTPDRLIAQYNIPTVW